MTSSVETTIFSPASMKGGTWIRRPFSKVADLYDEAAVWLLEVRIGFGDLEHHRLRQLDADRPVLVQLHLHVHAVLQEARALADEILGKLDLIVSRGIHEHELVALLVEKLKLPALDLGFLDLGRCCRSAG